MVDYYNVTTNTGDAEIAAAIASNTKFAITHIAFGDGNGAVPTPTKTRTTLVREVHRQAVTKYERHSTNANWIVIETIIPSNIGGFWVREMGVIANGKMISHGSHAPFEKVADPTGVSEYRLRFTQNVTDGSVVEITLDESLIYASQAWVEENFIKRTEIVDDLTTNDSKKPVSAKQAKVLQDNKLGKTENAATATKLATARTIGGVSFDGSANINLPGVNTAGNQSTTGNAATATSAAKWTTARTLTIGDSGKSVDGSDNVSWTRLDMGVPQTTTLTSVGVDNSESCIGYITNTLLGSPDGALYSHVYSEMWKHQIQGDYRTGQIALRGKNNGTWQAWRTVLDSGNYNNYSPTKTGTGASGSWGISITGNAATATTLQTARTIGGVPFDGTANIDLPLLGVGQSWKRVARSLSTIYTNTTGKPILVMVGWFDSNGGAGVSVDGVTLFEWSVDIQPSHNTHWFIVPDGSTWMAWALNGASPCFAELS